jgi:hypothetical protein
VTELFRDNASQIPGEAEVNAQEIIEDLEDTNYGNEVDLVTPRVSIIVSSSESGVICDNSQPDADRSSHV